MPLLSLLLKHCQHSIVWLFLKPLSLLNDIWKGSKSSVFFKIYIFQLLIFATSYFYTHAHFQGIQIWWVFFNHEKQCVFFFSLITSLINKWMITISSLSSQSRWSTRLNYLASASWRQLPCSWTSCSTSLLEALTKVTAV